MSSFTGPNAELMQRIDDLWQGGDLAAADKLYATDFAVNGTIVGPQGVKEFLLALRSAFSDMAFALGEVLVDGDRAALRFEQRGRHTGVWETPAGPLEPTGREFAIGGIEIFRFVEGKAAEAWVEYDMLGLLVQLGAFERP